MSFDENTWVSNVGGLVGHSSKGGYITNCSIKNTKETPVISGLFASFLITACSRPPEPITIMFIIFILNKKLEIVGTGVLDCPF